MLPTNKAEKISLGTLEANGSLSSVTRKIIRNQSLLESLHKNFLLKPAFKLFKNRGNYPAFWTMPYDPICREILFNGYYEKELLMGMCKLVENKSGTVLDIGANIGNHSVFFSREFEKVISFEPTPSNCWILKANLHLNNINNVQLIEKGLSNSNGKFYATHANAKNTNDGISKTKPNDTQDQSIIDVVIGDEELQKLAYSSPILMIKIDVEGAEPEVIMGLEQTISYHKPIIYWEAFNKDTVSQSKHLLEKLGYENFYHLTTNKFENKFMNKVANLLGKSVYLKPLDKCTVYDGMNVASPRKLM